jgi:hypothetical protein
VPHLLRYREVSGLNIGHRTNGSLYFRGVALSLQVAEPTVPYISVVLLSPCRSQNHLFLIFPWCCSILAGHRTSGSLYFRGVALSLQVTEPAVPYISVVVLYPCRLQNQLLLTFPWRCSILADHDQFTSNLRSIISAVDKTL